MVFKDKEEILRFVNKECYYNSPDSYCLGNNHTEAGKIFRQFVKSYEARKLKQRGNCHE